MHSIATHQEQMTMSDPSMVYPMQPGQSPPMFAFSSPEHQHAAWEQAMGGSRLAQYRESDIGDLLEQGGQYFPSTGNSYGRSAGYQAGARKVMESYEAFARTPAGKEMISRMGLPQWDGYAMLDLPGSALAATISSSDGRKILAWNSRYMDRIDAGLLAGQHLEQAVMQAIERYGHPFGDPFVRAAADFYEGMKHEGDHNRHGHQVFERSREAEEFATYMETAQFYRGLAERVKDSSYVMSKFYEAIADRSEAKARVYGKGGEDAGRESLERMADGAGETEDGQSIDQE